ncbi:MAG: DNA-binding protein [Pseudomonas sp.]|jgi:uncharacterized OB-fold protein|uniref:Zn-ribbon domain-containing OB-fold protein n=1 Tax=Pseudomonas sp. TaxID=306 RepID=UPI0026159BF6|nr:Zn-ribbon domain-containing OB-fold protein [Pseudomonas sp.]MDB6050821.1 DNA-binding protein [Pseudomonas sp.]
MPRKLPALNADNRAFWQGGEQGKLLIHHCDACGRFFHPPSPMCPQCASFNVAPRPVTGKGSVASFTVNHQPWTPELEAPYVVAIVELLEQPGLRFLSNIVNCDPATVQIGMRVKVRFEQVEDVWLPLFEKDQ